MKKRTTERLGAFLAQLRKSAQQYFSPGPDTSWQRSRRLTMESLEGRQVMAAAFLAPAEPAGNVNVQLVPLANVAAGAQEIVTFGVPFTRGSVTQSQLSQIRVLKNGVEIPAYVEQLTPWHSIDDAGIDGQSVRVARIQVPYTFATLNPESITVQWGGPARTLNRPALQDPRLEWHTVTSGSYVAADNVEEPDVLPVLPAAYLSKGMLDARTNPTNGSVAETRDNPAVMDAMNFTGYTEFDYAQKNFFYTTINQNPGITIDYKTQPEPWLYDRSSGMYELYLRSGFATALREAVRNTDFYADHIDAAGYFTLRPGDAKYAYNESLAYTHWLVGDDRMLAPISRVVNAHSGTATRWNPNLSFWTERNVGYKLLANQVAYEVTGSAALKTNVQTIVNDLVWHQNGAGGQLPSNRIDGGLYHTGAQHDISEASSGSVLIASSWMSGIIADSMVRTYGVWQSPQIADFMVRLGNFEKVASKTDAGGQFGGTTRYPDYLMRTDGTSDNRIDSDVQHAMDVGAVAAWATYFAELRGTPDASLRQLANDLYSTYDVGVNYWTRPGGTNFNVSPPRRYTWEYKNSASFSWALTGTDAPNQPGALQFSAASYTISEDQTFATITVARSGGTAGSVSVNYATNNGTATAGSDYTATSGTLTFADGETTKSFNLPILDDSLVENAETVTLTLSNPTGGASLNSPATATLTINSNDTTDQPISVSIQQGVNGYAGTTDVNISTQYAQYTGGNGTTTQNGAQLGVFQTTGTGSYAVESLLRFSDLGITSSANVTSASITLTVDTYVANPVIRGYYVNRPWSTGSGSDLGWLRTGTGQNWAAPGATGSGTDVIAGKSFLLSGITGTGAQSITVNLDPTVAQSWIDDPNANQGILLVNETTGAVVWVNASEHANVASRPKLNLTYTVGTPQAGSIQFSNPTYSASENGGSVATITVTRTGSTVGAASINYATANGTATAGSDYTTSSGTLNFLAGETSKTFTIPIINDNDVESPETVALTLSNPTGGAVLGSQATATLTINSEDVAEPGILQFSAPTYSVIESQLTVSITVTRTGGSNVPVSVNYATTNGTATAGSDYTATNGTLNFAAGVTSQTFSVPISNDTAVENAETVSLTLSNPTGGATLGSQSTATLTINSDDVAQPGVLQFGAAAYSVIESQLTATITVTRTGGNAGAVSINYATSNGTATAGSDYTTSNGTLSFAAGETTKTFTVPIINDTAVENAETVTLTLSNPTGGATLGGQSTATLTINSDDVAPPGVLQFSAAAYSVIESQLTATITVTRTGGSAGAVSINYATSNGTATAGSDYTASSGTLNFAAGETTKTFTVPIINDTAIENLETVTLTLSNPTGGATLGSQSTATLTINSDDTNGQPIVATLQQGVNGYTGTTDGNISTQYAQYTNGNGTTSFNDAQLNTWTTTGSGNYTTESLIRFSNLGIPAGAVVSGVTLTLNVYTWSNNPTIRGSYLQAPWTASSQLGWLNRGNGQQWATPGARGQGTDLIAGKSFVLPGIAASGSQMITVNLDPAVVQGWINDPSSNQGILLVNETTGAIVRIGASENSTASFRPKLSVTYTVGTPAPQPGALQFSGAAYAVNENGAGTATITVSRSGGSSGSVAVNYATSNGTATAGSDYTATTGTLNFAAGQTSQTFTIPIANDSAFEGNETINLTLSNPVGGATLGSQTSAVLTIQDDDPAPQPGALQFSAANYSLAENGGQLQVTVVRSGGVSGAVSVQYATASGTATAGSDYTAATGTLNFAAGETSKTFTIAVTDDTAIESSETLTLTLSNPTGGATLGTPASATFTIVDNDSQTPPGTFNKINAASGIDAIIAQKNLEDPNWWLTGQHLIDLDADGDLDLFLDAHVGNSVVALNDGHGVFTRATSGTWPSTEIHQMYDINADGKLDLSVTYQDGGSQWWLNQSTPGHVNFTPTNITRGGNTSRAQVMLDFNNDGKVDWLRSEQPGLVIDYGNGSGGFTSGSASFPIAGTTVNNNANFLPGDFDADGDIDLLVLTGGGYDGTAGKTAYWRNNGNQTFTDITASAGLPANGTVAKGVGDFDQDGDIDLIAIENKAMPPVIYVNSGQGVFTKKAIAISGVAAGTLDYSAWGTAVSTDFDNDGIADIIMNGKYYLKVLRGTGDGNFTYMNNAWGILDTAASAVDDGLCFGDIDNDGDLDIIGFNQIYPSRTLNVYRNDLAAQNWLNVRTLGLAGNPGAAGAKISIYTAGTDDLLWFEQVAQYDFQVATSYYGTAETERHFGLGSRASVDIVVQFPSGKLKRLDGVTANQTIDLLESEAS